MSTKIVRFLLCLALLGAAAACLADDDLVDDPRYADLSGVQQLHISHGNGHGDDSLPSVSATELSLSQIGTGNTAVIDQGGSRLQLLAQQQGVENQLLIQQSGSLNLLTVQQQGNGNMATIQQGGVYNQASTQQNGQNNQITLSQNGVQGYVSIVQNGSNLRARVSQW